MVRNDSSAATARLMLPATTPIRAKTRGIATRPAAREKTVESEQVGRTGTPDASSKQRALPAAQGACNRRAKPSAMPSSAYTHLPPA